MYKTVLLTVDLDAPASWKKALPEAIGIARTGQGTLHVLSVVPDYGKPIVSAHFPAGFRDKALDHAAEVQHALIAAEVGDAVPCVPHIAYGHLHEAVLDTAAKIGADLIVMASHAPDRVREFLVGSQADRVVRRSPVSVLVVRG